MHKIIPETYGFHNEPFKSQSLSLLYIYINLLFEFHLKEVIEEYP